jgi:hypothetical protein
MKAAAARKIRRTRPASSELDKARLLPPCCQVTGDHFTKSAIPSMPGEHSDASVRAASRQ